MAAMLYALSFRGLIGLLPKPLDARFVPLFTQTSIILFIKVLLSLARYPGACSGLRTRRPFQYPMRLLCFQNPSSKYKINKLNFRVEFASDFTDLRSN